MFKNSLLITRFLVRKITKFMPSKRVYLRIQQGVFESFRFELRKKVVQTTFFESEHLSSS